MLDLSEIKKSPEWTFFAEKDPFNAKNFVEGYVSRHNGDDYGALYIDKINYEKASQYILTTPKIGYPFDHSGHWYFPKAQKIERYEKLDGTNVFAFVYQDANGNKLVSYKTRLRPFITESKFGPFLSMWKDILDKNPNIAKLPLRLGMNMSFELWGARNPHLVKYEIPLEASLLFVRKEGKIYPPSVLFNPSILIDKAPGQLPTWAKFIGYVDKDYVWNYQQAQEESEKQLKETEDGYLGTEGEVWYLLDEQNNWTLFKCKPHSIEAIHWSQGGIGKNIIRATCLNAFENYDAPTVENVIRLLLEEFSQQEVDKVFYSIEKQLKEVQEQHIFSQNVLEEYSKLGLSILESKSEVMRSLSKVFEKSEMKRVYSAIIQHEVK